MSFYCSNSTGNLPGFLGRNNTTNSCCERVCINVKKVFDACLSQVERENFTVSLTNYDPSSYTLPLTFVSAQTTNIDATVTNLIIMRLDDNPNCARVKCTVLAPLTINYVDASGVEGSAQAVVPLEKDVVLYVPQPAIFPSNIEANVVIETPVGSISEDGTSVTITCCTNTILRCTGMVDIVVPSYGYCTIPPCLQFDDTSVCNGIFTMPLYPNPEV